MKEQRGSLITILLALSASAVLLAIVVVLHLWRDIPFAELTRDPVVAAGGSVYTGFLSQVGIFFWAAAAAISLFAAYVLVPHSQSHGLGEFLLVSGILTLYLGIDDVFLLHENILPYFGIPEKAILVSYGVVWLVWLVRYRSIILATEYIILAVSLLFLGVSILADLFDLESAGSYLLEDGAKLIGIVTWLAYFFRVSAHAVGGTGRYDG